jgi:arsenate reductase (glutaredoxin)
MAITVTVYGIPNCDATKKALQFLKAHNIEYAFNDYKEKGITKQKLIAWIDKAELDAIFNKRSTTWKTLTAAEQKQAATEAGAIAIMIANNSIIKRPVIEYGDALLIGFDEKKYKKHLL